MGVLVEAGTRWFKSLQSAEANVVNNMHSNGPWHAEGHAREQDDLAHCLGGARGRRNDVLRRTSAATPVLPATARPVHHQLSRGHRVNSGHETLDQAELFVHHLGQRRQTVGRA